MISFVFLSAPSLLPVVGSLPRAAVHLLGLTWHLRHGESQLYENGLSSSADHQQDDGGGGGKVRPTGSVQLLDTLNPENTHAGDKGELVTRRSERSPTDVMTTVVNDRVNTKFCFVQWFSNF